MKHLEINYLILKFGTNILHNLQVFDSHFMLVSCFRYFSDRRVLIAMGKMDKVFQGARLLH